MSVGAGGLADRFPIDRLRASTERATPGISEGTSSQAENVAAAEEPTSALDEGSRSVGDLSGRAGQFDELLTRFETDADADLEGALLGRVGESLPDDPYPTR